MAQAMYNVFKQTSSDISSMLSSPRVFALLIIYVYLNDTDVMQYLQLETVMHGYMSASMTFRDTRTARRVRIRSLYIMFLFPYKRLHLNAPFFPLKCSKTLIIKRPFFINSKRFEV